ncbi:plasmid maintenance system killer [Halothermothrix orenii H 168]|uniref:Plasmid maintenance system killer n=2 Tax=Halothermothrix orenii TaxID=31909 RepID=B8CZR3_HALOH|nr:plasmid maintenance system killer [Halothermothrix orenii H 168]
MILEFKSKKLLKLYTKHKKAQKKFGVKTARILVRRLNELQAFENLAQVPHKPPYRRHKLSGKYKGFFAVDVIGGYRIVFKPIIDSDRDIEEIPLHEINKIEIWEVTDYHD